MTEEQQQQQQNTTPVETQQKQQKPEKKQKKKGKKPKKQKPKQQQKKSKKNEEGISVTKDENFADWYQQVVTKAELIEYYDVSGCYILRPNSFSIWEQIQSFFDAKIKKDGVQNCYFPLFVAKSRLETEKDHVEGFAPEVAWVTHSGTTELAEHIAVRPTSETAMYPTYAKWIRSHRDLPLRLNQWCNVVRWEFQNPVPFIRSREFLWQEGHTAFATKEEADQEVLTILDYYAQVYEDLLAVPVIKGRKTEKEKFAGGDYTTTVEGYVPTNGRSIQAATSHHLGENFSKMFGIQYEDENKEKCNVWQNSWGLSTRSIGTMIMVHGDDKGLVMPPRVAPLQVVIIPLVFKGKQTLEEMTEIARKNLEEPLLKAGIRVQVDNREKNPGFKYNEWELKGIPLRLEVGPRDVEKNAFVAVRRDNGKKEFDISFENAVEEVKARLDQMHNDLLENARKVRMEHLKTITQWEEFVPLLNQKCQVLAPFCERVDCETKLKDRSGAESKEIESASGLTGAAKSLCIPLDQSIAGEELGDKKCFCCGEDAKSWTLFGRSY